MLTSAAAAFIKIFSVTKARLINAIRLDMDTDYRKTVLLSSLGRSGSTLISNLINYKNDYRIIFEPFKQEKIKIAAQFIYPTYLDPSNNSECISVPMNKILTGRLRSWWTDKPNERIITTQRLIKDIYMNLMLGWIKKHYPEIPIILLVRNPFPTVESWIRSDWGYLNPKKRMLEQRRLLEPLLPENVFYNYEKETNPLLNHFYNWCISYYLPLKTFCNNEIFVTYYENYLEEPTLEVKKLFSYINKPFDKKSVKQIERIFLYYQKR